MGTAKNESYSRHMSLLSDYVKEVCAYVERGQDLQDMGVDSDMTDKEYAYYMRSVERKHKYMGGTTRLEDIIPMLSEVKFSYAELSMSIRQTEMLLGVTFAPDYKYILSEYGGITYRYGQVLGLLSCIRSTMEMRLTPFVNSGIYYAVDEDVTAGSLFIQNKAGAIFKLSRDHVLTPYCSGISQLLRMQEFGLTKESALAM